MQGAVEGCRAASYGERFSGDLAAVNLGGNYLAHFSSGNCPHADPALAGYLLWVRVF